jgi:hypothetical protein
MEPHDMELSKIAAAELLESKRLSEPFPRRRSAGRITSVDAQGRPAKICLAGRAASQAAGRWGQIAKIGKIGTRHQK